MALPADYEQLISTDVRHASDWVELGALLADRAGWYFVETPTATSPGMWWRDGAYMSRLEVRPWGGRFEVNVVFLSAGDEAELFFEDFDGLKQWIVSYGEAFID